MKNLLFKDFGHTVYEMTQLFSALTSSNSWSNRTLTYQKLDQKVSRNDMQSKQYEQNNEQSNFFAFPLSMVRCYNDTDTTYISLMQCFENIAISFKI
jgi:hypothetical protein